MTNSNQKIYSIISYILLFSLCNTPLLALTPAPEQAKATTKTTLYKQIGNEYITPSELEESQAKPSSSKTKPWYHKLVGEEAAKVLFPDLLIKQFNQAQQKVFVFNKMQDTVAANDILLDIAWFDLELYRHSNFLDCIKRTRTVEGTAVLSKMLAQPTDNVQELSSRQQVLKLLTEDEQLLQDLDKALEAIAQAEAGYFALLNEDLESTQKTTMLVNGTPIAKSSKSAKVQEGWAVFNQSVGTIATLGLDALTVWSLYKVIKLGIKGGIETEFGGPFGYAKAMGIIYGLVVAPLIGLQTHTLTKNAIFTIPKFLQTRLKFAAQSVNAYQDLYSLIVQHPTICNNTIGFKNFEALLTGEGQNAKDFNNLLRQLGTNTFKGEHTIFSVTGRILASSLIIQEEHVKTQLISLLEAVGCIDAYVAMAKLYKEHQGTNTEYCFVEYAQSSTPYLSLDDFWNPLVGKNAIPNTIEFGGNNSRNMILTGQNTAGKSTILKAITYAILLGQTFGIAPAKNMVFTPFSIINTYVNVTDDIANNRSLFANEVFRAKGLLDRVQTLDANKFSFTIIDEMFRGTGPEHAEVLSYSYAKKLADHQNAIVIESTHYPKLVELEKETNGIYTNYKIDILKAEDGSLIRPYKIEKGFTLVNIAHDILKEAGLLLE